MEQVQQLDSFHTVFLSIHLQLMRWQLHTGISEYSVVCFLLIVTLKVLYCCPLRLHFLELLLFAQVCLVLWFCLLLLACASRALLTLVYNNETVSSAAVLGTNCIPKRDGCLYSQVRLTFVRQIIGSNYPV